MVHRKMTHQNDIWIQILIKIQSKLLSAEPSSYFSMASLENLHELIPGDHILDNIKVS
jgi:hypothetical protein